jgi:hypothetical protein
MDLDQIAQQIAEDIETQCTDVTDPFIKAIVRRAIRDARRAGREQLREIIRSVHADYPPDVWPEDSMSSDGLAGRAYRHACMRILDEINALSDD